MRRRTLRSRQVEVIAMTPADTCVVVELDSCQRGAVLTALTDERNELIKQGRPTDTVSEAILKVAQAPPKKRRSSHEAR